MILQIVVVIAAAVVLFYSFTTINRMTPKTDHRIRLAFVLIACGAFGQLVAIFEADHVPGVAETLFVVGNGLLAFFCRRIKPRPTSTGTQVCQANQCPSRRSYE